MSHSPDYSDFGIELRPGGGVEQSVNCPKCSQQRKKKRARCLSVNTEKEVWICHHCGWTGNLSKGAHFSDPHWVKPDYRKPKLLVIKDDLPVAIAKWLNGRGISNKTLNRNKITVNNVWMPQVEKEVSAMGFPYYRNGEHINTKWRDKDKNFRLEAGAELILYGLDDIKGRDTIIWVEGEMDKLSLEEAGYINCVSIPNGAPSPNSKHYASHFDYLVSAEEDISGKKHILFVDADVAGVRLEEELSRRLGKELCKRVCLPDGYKDANELLMALGAESVADAVKDAKPFPVSGIHDGNSLAGKVKYLHEHGLTKGMGTGWPEIDDLYSARAGEMTIVTGIPNHGKSNFLDCLTLNIATLHGWRFGMFSPENQPLELHAAGLVEKFNRKPFESLGADYVEATMKWIHQHYHWILPDLDDDWSLQGILDKAKTLVFRHGINGLVIDPWNEIEHRRPAGLSETEYISHALTKIRQFARIHNVHVWVVAHPTKLRKDDNGIYPPPTLYDISGSSNWRNKADNGITVYRHFTPGQESQIDIHITKIRFKEIGRIGVATLTYDKDLCNYRGPSHFDGDE